MAVLVSFGVHGMDVSKETSGEKLKRINILSVSWSASSGIILTEHTCDWNSAAGSRSLLCPFYYAKSQPTDGRHLQRRDLGAAFLLKLVDISKITLFILFAGIKVQTQSTHITGRREYLRAKLSFCSWNRKTWSWSPKWSQIETKILPSSGPSGFLSVALLSWVHPDLTFWMTKVWFGFVTGKDSFLLCTNLICILVISYFTH